MLLPRLIMTSDRRELRQSEDTIHHLHHYHYHYQHQQNKTKCQHTQATRAHDPNLHGIYIVSIIASPPPCLSKTFSPLLVQPLKTLKKVRHHQSILQVELAWCAECKAVQCSAMRCDTHCLFDRPLGSCLLNQTLIAGRNLSPLRPRPAVAKPWLCRL